ncbi:MAG TPA: flagellar hook-basal body complex protein FliE [Solirubrobacterales bacterium]|nr:flagellar hook-basal body complex protein FliE [Solirubrobacterales bacterium]
MTLPVSAIGKAAEQISLGPQGSVGPAKSAAAQPSDPAGGFGSMLTNAIGDLQKTQEAASVQSQELATGQTQDISSVVTAVQEAQLSMQLAAQVRNKAVEAYTEIFHTQI